VGVLCSISNANRKDLRIEDTLNKISCVNFGDVRNLYKYVVEFPGNEEEMSDYLNFFLCAPVMF